MSQEKELLVKISNADETAYRQFFEMYVNKVYQFIFRFIKEKTEAEDITQIVFIKIWDKRDTFNTIKSLDGFVFTVTYRLVIDHFRSSSVKFQKNFNHQFLSDEYKSSLTAEDSINKHHLESIYQKALEMLPPKRKEIFILSRHEGLNNKQIAERLQISVKTVENQMTAAITSLRDFFIKSDFFIFIVFGIFLFG